MWTRSGWAGSARVGSSLAILGAASAVWASAAFAQQPAPPTPPTCPASGFAPVFYGVAGDNDGQQRGYEIASPCIGKEVRDAAVAVGMGRWTPLGVKTLSTMRFKAKGRMAAEAGGPLSDAEVDISMDFTLPAARIDVVSPGKADKTGKAGTAREIRVVSGAQAWDEETPGVNRKAVAGAAPKRAPLLKLTPFGALWSVIEAEGTAKVSKDAQGRTVITGASPLDRYQVAVTLDAQSRPVRVVEKAEGKTYEAAFSDYSAKWESAYLFVFPAHISWSLNGKPIADLEVTHYHSNPYVVFPPPRPAG